MKKFKFKLQRLLDIRIRKEDLLRDELMILNAKLKLEQDRLTDLITKTDKTLDTIKKIQTTQATTPEEMTAFQTYLQSLANQKANQKLFIKQAQERVDHKREEVIEASKERKIIDKLKEHEYFDYLVELDKWDQKVTEEMAISIFNRHKKESV